MENDQPDLCSDTQAGHLVVVLPAALSSCCVAPVDPCLSDPGMPISSSLLRRVWGVEYRTVEDIVRDEYSIKIESESAHHIYTIK